MTKHTAINYRDLTAELEALIAKLERGDIDIDETVQAYERGAVIISLLEDHLKKAENKVISISSKLNRESED